MRNKIESVLFPSNPPFPDFILFIYWIISNIYVLIHGQKNNHNLLFYNSVNDNAE